MTKTMIATLALLVAGAANAGVDLTQADCNHAEQELVKYNAKLTANQDYHRTFADKATYAYALACQDAGLINFPMYLEQAPEASKEVREYCIAHAKSRGETESCLATGKLDTDE